MLKCKRCGQSLTTFGRHWTGLRKCPKEKKKVFKKSNTLNKEKSNKDNDEQ